MLMPAKFLLIKHHIYVSDIKGYKLDIKGIPRTKFQVLVTLGSSFDHPMQLQHTCKYIRHALY